MLPAASCDRVTCLCSQLLGGMLQSSRSCDHKMPQTKGFSNAPGSGVNLIGHCPQAWRGKLSSPATPIVDRDLHPNRSRFRFASQCLRELLPLRTSARSRKEQVSPFLEDAMAANTPRKPFWAATMVAMALSSSTVCSAGGQIETFDHRSASQRNTSNLRDVDTGIDNASHNRSANDAARREHSGVRLFRNVNHPRSTYISATVFP